MTDFGTDISTYPDLDPSFGVISGQRVLAEAIARRLSTPAGTLTFSPDFGKDIRDSLNESFTQAKLSALQRAIRAEVEKDERVLSASVVVAYDAPSSTIHATIALESAAGPFNLVLAISAVSITVLDAR
jgi:phage baseplate assembly protein W